MPPHDWLLSLAQPPEPPSRGQTAPHTGSCASRIGDAEKSRACKEFGQGWSHWPAARHRRTLESRICSRRQDCAGAKPLRSSGPESPAAPPDGAGPCHRPGPHRSPPVRNPKPTATDTGSTTGRARGRWGEATAMDRMRLERRSPPHRQSLSVQKPPYLVSRKPPPWVLAEIPPRLIQLPHDSFHRLLACGCNDPGDDTHEGRRAVDSAHKLKQRGRCCLCFCL